jgi:hypothetical protein
MSCGGIGQFPYWIRDRADGFLAKVGMIYAY